MSFAQRLCKVATAAVSDCQGSFGPVHSAIRPRVPGKVAAGPAFTVKCYPGSILTVHRALLEAKPGDFLVVDGEADDRGALMGELMALQMKVLGFAGIVIDGPVRDVTGLQDVGFPVWSRSVTPRVGSNRRIGEAQIPVSCGGVVVRPGDWILADDDGVVVIPAEKVAEVTTAAEGVIAHEAEVAHRIKSGELIADILNMRGGIYPK